MLHLKKIWSSCRLENFIFDKCYISIKMNKIFINLLKLYFYFSSLPRWKRCTSSLISRNEKFIIEKQPNAYFWCISHFQIDLITNYETLADQVNTVLNSFSASWELKDITELEATGKLKAIIQNSPTNFHFISR